MNVVKFTTPAMFISPAPMEPGKTYNDYSEPDNMSFTAALALSLSLIGKYAPTPLLIDSLEAAIAALVSGYVDADITPLGADDAVSEDEKTEYIVKTRGGVTDRDVQIARRRLRAAYVRGSGDVALASYSEPSDATILATLTMVGRDVLALPNVSSGTARTAIVVIKKTNKAHANVYRGAAQGTVSNVSTGNRSALSTEYSLNYTVGAP